MIKIKFKNRSDEIIFFVRLNEIEKFTGIKIRYAECISDEQAEIEKDDE